MVNSKTKIKAIGTDYCMCGCGQVNTPRRRFSQGHDASLMRTLRLVEQGELDGTAISEEIVKAVRENPELGVGPYTGDDILRLAAIRFSHPEASRRFMRHAKLEFKRRDLPQASEKAWGAAAHAVKAAAEVRGLAHNKHRDLINVVGQLVVETGQDDIQMSFHAAEALHANFYENWMNADLVRRGISNVERFLSHVEPLYGE